jgi:hypothetical protein
VKKIRQGIFKMSRHVRSFEVVRRSRSKWLNGTGGWQLPVTACLIFCLGCGYPEVSPKTYEISKALYAVCNLKQKDDLDKVTDVISEAVSESEVSEDESEWLLAIVEKAGSGEWEEAAEDARSILEDQVDR